MARIGEEIETIEFEPIPDEIPAPAEPVVEPVKEPEPVGAP